MVRKDFHGYKLEDAVREVEQLIGEIRIANTPQHAKFITGHGIIKDTLIQLLHTYNLNPAEDWTNAGVITVAIE
jgi:hypothetical protein